MTMRGGSRRSRAATAVEADAFAWDRALTATLRHSSLPWSETVAATSLSNAPHLGARDRLSLVAQFAAHQALLQFAGIADGELDPAEWSLVQKRGSDVRLIRVGARASDPSVAPPVVTVVQQFAEQLGVELDVLRHSWARADAIYAEAFARLARDVAADLRWVRRSACGAVVSPGPEGLRAIANDGGRYSYPGDECVDAVQRFAELDRTLRPVVIRGASPLERYSALAVLAADRTLPAAMVAERLLAATSRARHVFIVADEDALDEGSRQVIDLLSNGGHGTWLVRHAAEPLPETRRFVIAPRLDAAARLLDAMSDANLESFVDSTAFAAYLARGETPQRRTALPALAEPARSYVGALALLGSRIRCDVAVRFLSEFLFTGELEQLALEGLGGVDGDCYVFESEAIRDEAARLIPPASRPAICRVAAAHASGVDAALLWLEAGEPLRAAEALDQAEWIDAESVAEALQRVPLSILTPALASRYAHALVECGRYRDAISVAPADELLVARAERRMGDYATALARLERTEPSFESMLLQAELLRLIGRGAEALRLLALCRPASHEERARLDYERGLHGEAVGIPAEHYLGARLATYRALERGDHAEASARARESHGRARNATERIDSSLDLVYATFCSGAWDEARALAVAALREVEETQGDRAAGGILFTLAWLAADDAQWAHASQRIARLRHYYTATGDRLRLGELQLLAAHLDFSRGRFADARRAAQAVLNGRAHHDQIREAAALIVDELDWMEGSTAALQSTGVCENAELRRRRERIAIRAAAPAAPSTVPEKLFAFRRAVASGDDETARRLATELDLLFEPSPVPADVELRVLRNAALHEFPFAPHDFDVPWCFATRNRLGHWSAIGSYSVAPSALDAADGLPDWIACSDRELLYLEGSSTWTSDGRDAVAAIFRTRAENHRLRRIMEQEGAVAQDRGAAIDGLVGESPAIRAVESLVARVARRDVAVCILGESGTGKELVARAIHRHSQRRQKAFTAVNCAALPENLVESELFGHVRGAFTGADRDRAGLIETTDGGTLFLDEIGELPLVTQAKLLRLLQEGEFRRVGDTMNRSADVRIVSATNRKLDAAVESGRFREDLYYRVRGVEVVLPPLRQRGGDILLLTAHFLAAEREKHRAGPAALSEEAAAIFSAYAWPGNVRELQNTIRAAHAMAGEAKEIDVEHLPERLRSVVPARVVAGSYHDAVSRFKRDLIERSLLAVQGNQNRAAGLLRMSRQALAYQIRELGIMVGERKLKIEN